LNFPPLFWKDSGTRNIYYYSNVTLSLKTSNEAKPKQNIDLDVQKDINLVQKCDNFLTMTGFKFLPWQQKATPAYGNACLHEAFRRKQALRRGGTAFDEWAKRLAGMSPHWGVK
jgi:hypothetical protein